MSDTITDPADNRTPSESTVDLRLGGDRIAEWICRSPEAAEIRRGLRDLGVGRWDAVDCYLRDVRPDVSMTPPVAIDYAPEASGIYFMWGPPSLRLDRPIYIGASVSLRSRMRGWFGTGAVLRHPWPEPIALVTMTLYERGDLAEVERHEIETWSPPRNLAGIEIPYAADGCWR